MSRYNGAEGLQHNIPELGTIKSLTVAAGLIAIVIAVTNLILGFILMPFMGIGFIPLVLSLINFWVFWRCKNISDAIEAGRLEEARDMTLTPMVFGFIFSWVIVGILLLIAYMKYDSAIRAAAQ